ncbi:flagellar protein FlgN [Roseovarius nanhaiticus]|uniref:flagellar protein FlgN n=1 Tax=Roseovarius nanhaiticus TaxID=573024 RepID=UPI00248F5BC6|nr:flagellar protein FlgN [Roseovarius nanhaiticus]
MTRETAEQIRDRMDRLLDQERAALLAGDLEMIGTLMTLKEEVIDALNAIGPEAGNGIKSLHGKVMRNQALLDGALQGIRTVAGRLSTLRRIRRSLETYDRSGRKSSISDVIDHQVERRA